MNALAKTLSPSIPTVSFDGNTQDSRASVLAAAIGHSLDSDLNIIAKAKQDYEGGPFRVMFTVLAKMTSEQIDSLPDTLADTGNNPRFYKSKIRKEDGTDKTTDHDYYKVLAESLPGITAKTTRIDMLGRSMKDPTKYNLSDVSQDIKDMPRHMRQAEISRLQGEVTTAKSAIVKAFELFWQLKRFDELQGCTASIIYAVDAKGNLLNGEDGRAIEVENTRKPIIIRTKLEARKDTDYAMVGVGQFLKLKVASIKEQGGSYQAFEASTAKGTKGKDDNGKSNAVNIETTDTAERVVNDYAEYLARIQMQPTKADWQSLEKATHGPGSDDHFYNCRVVFEALRLLVDNPKDQVRWQKLFAEREQG